MRLIPTSSGKLWAASKRDMEVLTTKPSRIIFDLIWNLAAELSNLVGLETYYARKVLWGNIRDYNIPTNRQQFVAQVHEVCQALRANGKVAIHCFGGHGRTSTVLACILKEMNRGLPTEEALKIASYYCRGPETIDQIQFVMDYCK